MGIKHYSWHISKCRCVHERCPRVTAVLWLLSACMHAHVLSLSLCGRACSTFDLLYARHANAARFKVHVAHGQSP